MHSEIVDLSVQAFDHQNRRNTVAHNYLEGSMTEPTMYESAAERMIAAIRRPKPKNTASFRSSPSMGRRRPAPLSKVTVRGGDIGQVSTKRIGPLASLARNRCHFFSALNDKLLITAGETAMREAAVVVPRPTAHAILRSLKLSTSELHMKLRRRAAIVRTSIVSGRLLARLAAFINGRRRKRRRLVYRRDQLSGARSRVDQPRFHISQMVGAAYCALRRICVRKELTTLP